MDMSAKRCVKSTEFPTELLSTVTLTTKLLPIRASKCSHREHPPDYFDCDSNGNQNIRSINNSTGSNCHSKNWSSACTSSFYYVKNKNLLLDKETQFVGVTKPKCKMITTTLRSTTFPLSTNLLSSPALKVSHRKIKCSRSHTTKCDESTLLATTVANVLRTIVPWGKPFSALPTKVAGAATSSKTKSEAMHYKAILPAKRSTSTRTKFRLLPSLGATSFFTLLTLVCLETVLLSTMSNCAKTFYMHWNTSNSIFRIDNTDHIIDVNKGNLAFEFDQVHIICPVYEPGTFENETEKYIIYNVSKVEYETCRITNADPRVIAICDKPQKLMFFTITFRPFTPQPGGLEFLPGNDYYFISTSSKDDLYRRIGGRCSTNNMKVVFKVCCAPEEKNATGSSTGSSVGGAENVGNGATVETVHIDSSIPTNSNQHHTNNINSIGINGVNTGGLMAGTGNGINFNGGNGGVQLQPANGPSGTSINTNIDQFNRIPIQTNGINAIGNNIGGVGLGSHAGSGILLTPGHGGINMIPSGGSGIVQYNHPGQTGIRINNVPPQHHPSHKNSNNDDHFDKHPNEVVKNEELTYNSGAASNHRCSWKFVTYTYEILVVKLGLQMGAPRSATTLTAAYSSKSIGSISNKIKFLVMQWYNKMYHDQLDLNLNIKIVHTTSSIILNSNPIILLSILLVFATHCIFKCTLNSSILSLSSTSVAKPTQSVHVVKSAKSSYLPIEHSKINKSVSVHLRKFR